MQEKAAAAYAAHVKRYGQIFRETVALLKDKAIPLAVVYNPDSDTAEGVATSNVEPIIRALTQETATPYFDLSPAMRAEKDPAERLYLLQRIHGRL
jgi:hypothetical protein